MLHLNKSSLGPAPTRFLPSLRKSKFEECPETPNCTKVSASFFLNIEKLPETHFLCPPHAK